MTRCTHQSDIYKYSSWFVAANERHKADLRVVARLTTDNDGLLDFFIFPNGIIRNSRITLSVTSRPGIGIYRFVDIERLLELLLFVEVTDSLPAFSRHWESCMSSSATRFAVLQHSVGQLVVDEDFRTLLRAEGYTMIPWVFWNEISHPGEQALAVVICEAYLERILMSGRVPASSNGDKALFRGNQITQSLPRDEFSECETVVSR